MIIGKGVDMDTKTLLEKMEEGLQVIIEENGFQEMADGFCQAVDIVKEHFGIEDADRQI